MSNYVDYEWRRGENLRAFGCIGIVGLGVILCTGVIKDWREHKGEFSIRQQAGENLYVFLCEESDRGRYNPQNTSSCFQQERLFTVYEDTTPQNWRDAPVSWISYQHRFLSKDEEWCSQASYNLGQCYALEPERSKLFSQYVSDRSLDDAKFDRDLNRNNGM